MVLHVLRAMCAFLDTVVAPALYVQMEQLDLYVMLAKMQIVLQDSAEMVHAPVGLLEILAQPVLHVQQHTVIALQTNVLLLLQVGAGTHIILSISTSSSLCNLYVTSYS